MGEGIMDFCRMVDSDIDDVGLSVDKWMAMNWKRCGRKRSWPNQDTFSEFEWRYWGKPQKQSVMIVCILAEIRT
jgi:hypothetical protein